MGWILRLTGIGVLVALVIDGVPSVAEGVALVVVALLYIAAELSDLRSGR